MKDLEIIDWLLEGDIAIQYQVYRDLLEIDRKELQLKIAYEGWGLQFLAERKTNGHWGDGFYQPKWISTHYTLLDLRNLNIDPDNDVINNTIEMILDNGKSDDGGIPLGPSTKHHSDLCVNGMFLNYASYFNIAKKRLYSIIDNILREVMPDGGFNCRTTRSGAKHSSLHSTISVLEGLTEFQRGADQYRFDDVQRAIKSAQEFILLHRLFLSDRTGEIISKDFLKLTYPYRWKYDILRALDYFQYAGFKWDERLENALNIIEQKKNKNGTWNNQAPHPGKVHFTMEKAGAPSRWNTLRAMRIRKHYKSISK